MKATAPKFCATARVAAVVIGCSLAATTMASSNKVTVCDKTVSDDMKTLDVPLEDISVSAADHISREKPGPIIDSLADSLENADRDAAAVTVPSVLLTPRAGSEFDYVFSPDSDAAATTGDDVSDAVEEDAATAPSASNTDVAEEDELSIQNRMLRKDI